MGRRKIEIQPLTDERNRSVTFLKRKAGLFKKAHELAVLCQIDIAVIIFGSNKKLYEFSSTDTDGLIERYKMASPHEKKGPEDYGVERPHADDDDDDDDETDRASTASSPAGFKAKNKPRRAGAAAKKPHHAKSLSSSSVHSSHQASQPPPPPAAPGHLHQMQTPPQRLRATPQPQLGTPQHYAGPAPGYEQQHYLSAQHYHQQQYDMMRRSVHAQQQHTPPLQHTPRLQPQNTPQQVHQSPHLSQPGVRAANGDPGGSVGPPIEQHPAHSLSPPQPAQYQQLPRPVSQPQVGLHGGFAHAAVPPQPYFNNAEHLNQQLNARPKLKVQIPVTKNGGNEKHVKTESSGDAGSSPHRRPGLSPSTSSGPNSTGGNSGPLSGGPWGTSGNSVLLPPPSPSSYLQNNNNNVGPGNPFGRLPLVTSSSNGEQTPLSALPSKYLSDLLPSPSNFYGSEWNASFGPTSATPQTSTVGGSTFAASLQGRSAHLSVDVLPSPLQFSTSGVNGASGGGTGSPAERRDAKRIKLDSK